MIILSDGLSVMREHWALLLFLLTLIVSMQLLMWMFISRILGAIINFNEQILIAFMGWLVPLYIISTFYMTIRDLIWIPLVSLLAFILYRFKINLKHSSIRSTLAFSLVILLLLPIRLAYVSNSIFPSYFDSAEHYGIIKDLLANSFTPPRYYHVGFHLIAAFIAGASSVDINTVMLIFGQVLLILLPLGSYGFVWFLSRSRSAALVAAALTGFGWPMPAHAVDWGKYPALTAMCLIPFVATLTLVFINHKGSLARLERIALLLLVVISVAITGLIHTRALIVFGMLIFALGILRIFARPPERVKSMLFIGFLFIIVFQMIMLHENDLLAILFSPYQGKSLMITLIVFVLSVFAWKRYSNTVFGIFFFICLLLMGLLIPVRLERYGVLTLLDRPYVEMLLVLPLSVLGGVGTAGLGESISVRKFSVLLAFLIVIHAVTQYDMYPDPCCVIVGNDDVVAIDWMANQLPVDARIGISSTQLSVTALNEFEGVSGSDAGIWIHPLTGLKTYPIPFDNDFDQTSTLDFLCAEHVTHVYAGGVGISFDRTKIDLRPKWYTPLLTISRTGVYEVTGCN